MKKQNFLFILNNIIYPIGFLLIISIAIYLSLINLNINKIQYADWELWKAKSPLYQQRNWTTEQKLYYKVLLKIIHKDAPEKSSEDLDFLATMLVTSSKYIPYFAGLIYSESVLPGKWKRRGRYIITIRTPRFWYNFTIKKDPKTPSYGWPKIKLSTIKEIARRIGDKIPRYGYQINIHKLEWKIKLIKYAGIYYDYVTKVFYNNPLDGFGAYKMGIPSYKKWKKRKWKNAKLYELIGYASEKTLEIQNEFIKELLYSNKEDK